MGQLHHGSILPKVPKLLAEIHSTVTESGAENDLVLEGSDPTEIQDLERSSEKAKATPVNRQKTRIPDTPDFDAKTESNPFLVDDPTHHISKQSKLEEFEVDTAKESYTICAPQLLHLDAEGRPLWLNG